MIDKTLIYVINKTENRVIKMTVLDRILSELL